MPVVGGVTPLLSVAWNSKATDAVGPTFTPVPSSDVLEVNVDRGRDAYSRSYHVGQMTVLLRNDHGRYTPNPSVAGRAGGPYGDWLRPDLHVILRCKATGLTPAWPATDVWPADGLWPVVPTQYVFYGYSATWEPSESFGSLATVLLTCYDALWLAGRFDLRGSGYPEYVKKLAPAGGTAGAPDAYWRLGSRDTGTVAWDELANKWHGRYVLSPRVAAAGLVTADADEGMEILRADAAHGMFVGPPQSGLQGSGACGFALLYKPTAFPPSGQAGDLIMSDYGTGGGFAQRVRVTVTDAGKLRVEYPPLGNTFDSARTLVVGVRYSILLQRTVSGGNTTWSLLVLGENDTAYTLDTTALAGVVALTHDTGVIVGGFTGYSNASGASGVVDEVMVWTTATAPSGFPVTGFRAFLPGISDVGYKRFQDIWSWVGLPTSRQVVPSSPSKPYNASMLGALASVPGSNALGALTTLADSTSAEVYADRSGNAVFSEYRYPASEPAPTVTFDEVGGGPNPKIRARQLLTGAQDQKSRTTASDGTVSVTIDNPLANDEASSGDSVSVFRGAFKDLPADVALRRSRQLFSPRPRLDPVEVQLAGLTGIQRNAVLALDLTSPVKEVRHGVGTTGKVIRLRHKVDLNDWVVTLSTEPHPTPYQAYVRATSTVDTAVTDGTTVRPSMASEDWDTDAMHQSVLLDPAVFRTVSGLPDPAVYPNSSAVVVEPGVPYLVLANVLWGASALGRRLLLMNDSLGRNYVRARDPGIDVTQLGEGTAQAVASLVAVPAGATAPIYVEVQAALAANGGGTSRIVSSSRTVGFGPFSPALDAVRIAHDWYARVKRTANLSVASSTAPTQVPYDAEDADPLLMHDTATNNGRITVPVSGAWLVGTHGSFAANATGRRGWHVGNGTSPIGVGVAMNVSASQNAAFHSSSVWRALPGEWFDSSVFQDSGSALNLLTTGVTDESALWAVLLGHGSVRVTNSVAYDGAGGNPAAVADVTDRICTFDSERWDELDEHSAVSSTGRLTAATDGLRAIWGNVRWAANAAGNRRIFIRLNGRDVIREVRQPATATGNAYSQVLALWPMKAGDYVELGVWQSSGGPLAVEKAADYTPEFAMALVERAPTFDPVLRAGLLAWYRADSLGLADGTAVASWFDSSGKGRHLVQATGARQPLLRTGVLNGRPAVRFDGADDAMTAAFGSVTSQPTTVFVVAKTATPAASQQMFVDGTAAHRQAVYHAGGAWAAYAGSVLTAGANDSSFHVFCDTFDGASSKVRVGGGAGTTGNAGTDGIDGLTLGLDPFLTAALALNGDIAEVVVYAGALSLADLDAVGAYLAAKYALAWTAAA